MKKEKRKSGISVVGDVSWGTHLCQFYKTKEDLLDILVPYFKAGLENNEFCMWVTSEPLNVEEAKTALGKVVKNLDDYIKKGQIEILDYRSWYVKSKKFDSDRVLKGWVEKEKYALQNGFDGLRLTGNMFWLGKNDWDDFKSYEETVNDVIDKHRMIAICSYSLEKCNTSEIIDVVSNHQFAIIRRESKWNIIENSERRGKAEGQLKNSEELYKNLVELAPDSIVTMDLKGYITSCNSAAARIFRYSKDDLVGKHFSKIGILHVKDIPKYLKIFVSELRGKGTGIYELTINDKDGTSRIVETHIGLIKENNKISGVCAIIRDMTERKKIEKEIIESEEKLKQILDSSPDAITVTDLNGNIIECNQATLKIYGSPKAELIGKNALELFSPKDRKKAKDNLQKTLELGSTKNVEYTLTTKDGREYPAELSASLIRDASGYPQSFVAIVRDITKRKKAEEKLRESEKQYRNLIENAPIGIAVTAAGKVVFCNRKENELFGIASSLEMQGRAISEFVCKDDLPKFVRLAQSIRRGKVMEQPVSFRGVRADGKEIVVEGFALRGQFGAEESCLSFHQDITERKRTEEALRQLNRELRAISNCNQILLRAVDEQTLLNEICRIICDEAGYRLVWVGYAEHDEAKTIRPVAWAGFDSGYIANTKLTWADDTERGRGPAGKAIRSDEIIYVQDFTTDPQMAPWRESALQHGYRSGIALPLKDENAKVFGVLLIYSAEPNAITPDEIRLMKELASDLAFGITSLRIRAERKCVEDTLKETERAKSEFLEKLNEAQHLAMIGSWEWNLQPNNVWWSDETYRIFGVTPQDFVPSFEANRRFIHPDDFAIYDKSFEHSFQTGEQLDFDVRLVANDGLLKHCHAKGKIIYDDSGQPIRFIGTILDITERKQAEAALKESEEKFRTIFENNSSAMAIIERDTTISMVNRKYCEMSLYEEQDVIGKSWTKQIPPEDLKRMKEYNRKRLIDPKNAPSEYEFMFYRKDGEIRHCLMSVGILPTSQKIVTSFTDITERKKAEENLRQSEEKFRLLFNDSPAGIALVDPKGIIKEVNKSLLQLLPIKEEEFIGKNFIQLASAFGLNTKEYISDFQKRIAGELPKREITFLSKENRQVTITVESSVIKSGDEILGILFILHDITEHKRVEEIIVRSEKKFRELANSLPEIVYETDEHANFTFVNQTSLSLTGYTQEDFKSLNASQIVAPIDRERVKNNILKLLQGETIPSNEYLIQRKDGTTFPALFHSIPIIKENKIAGFRGFAVNITERKKAEDALKQSEEKYRFLFNDVPVGIGMVDESGRVVDCNHCMAEMFRMTFEEFKAINVKSLYVNPKDRERLQNLLNKEGKVIDWECAFKRKDGTAFFAILNTDVIEREGQKLNLTTLRDITERKVAEEKIKKQNVQLKKLDGVKTDFLNTTSHELRTPVASIKGYIQMLLKQTLGEITEEQKKALEVLLRNTNRLDHLIQDILDISRLESGTMKFITEKTDATKMIKEIAETMQTSADLKRIKIKIDIQEGIPDLLIDGERIKQVLLNLVDNAIKFSPDGSTINVKTRKEKEDVLFEVQDFGRGIPKNKQKKIFERFYQVDSGIDRKFGGVGLGLTISKKIINTFGGQIWVDSTLGKGSSFKFTLPM